MQLADGVPGVGGLHPIPVDAKGKKKEGCGSWKSGTKSLAAEVRTKLRQHTHTQFPDDSSEVKVGAELTCPIAFHVTDPGGESKRTGQLIPDHFPSSVFVPQLSTGPMSEF